MLAAALVSWVSACGVLVGQTSVSIEISFSGTARDPVFLSQMTDSITLSIAGEGLSQPIEKTLAPRPQVVTLPVPPGYKDYVAKAWRGNQLLGQGEAGAVMERGRQASVIMHLVPISDPPAGLPGAQILAPVPTRTSSLAGLFLAP